MLSVYINYEDVRPKIGIGRRVLREESIIEVIPTSRYFPFGLMCTPNTSMTSYWGLENCTRMRLDVCAKRHLVDRPHFSQAIAEVRHLRRDD